MKKFYILLTVLAVVSAGSVNAQVVREVAESDYLYPSGLPVHSDSITYNYTGNRGGNPNSLVNFYIDYSTSTYFNFNTAKSTFYNGYLYQQTFDGNNNITNMLIQQWDTTQLKWVNFNERISQYSGANHDTLDENETWDTTTAKWVPAYLSHNIWVNNFVTLNRTQLYDTTKKQFVNSSQVIYAPTAAGADSFRLFQNWDTTRQAWYSFELDSRYYDAAGNDTSTIAQGYDTTNHVWNPFIKVTTGYNGNHVQTSDCVLYWDAGTTSYDSSEREFFLLDAFMNDTLTLDQDYTNPGWVNDAELQLTYISDSLLTFEGRTNWNGASFDPEYSDYYYYEIFNGINNISNAPDGMLLYPNPSSGIVNVTATLPQQQPVQVAVYNMAGQQVYSLNMGTAKRIEAMVPVNSLAAGMYIVTVKQGNTLMQKNMVVGK